MSSRADPDFQKSVKLLSSKWSCEKCSGPKLCQNMLRNCCPWAQFSIAHALGKPRCSAQVLAVGQFWLVPSNSSSPAVPSATGRASLVVCVSERAKHEGWCEEQPTVGRGEGARDARTGILLQPLGRPWWSRYLPAVPCVTPWWRRWRFPEGTAAMEDSCRSRFVPKDCSLWRGTVLEQE